MKKVYLVIRKLVKPDGVFTDIIHICTDLDLAVEKANEYIVDSISDMLAPENKPSGYKVADISSTYRNAEDLMYDGVEFISFDNGESYLIRIEEHELKED